MRLVEKHIITKDNLYYREVDDLCFRAKNLYNVGLYTIRQHYFKTKIFLGYENLQKQLQQNKQVDYYALPTKVSQQILRLTCKNFESFFKAWQSYKKNPGKFKAPPKLPKYKHKTKGRSLVIYPIDAINKKMLKDFIYFGKKTPHNNCHEEKMGKRHRDRVPILASKKC